MNEKCFAAIDLGTNSCRLLICNEDGKEVCKETVPTRLGEGLYKDMKFTPQAIERGVKCFYDFKQHIDRFNVVKLRAVATAGCRMASNSDEFLRQVFAESRIAVEIIDGYEEARLNLKGAMTHVKGKSRYVVVFDLGGGSTEMTLATNEVQPKIIYTSSIPWGARNAAEAFELKEFNVEGAKRLTEEVKKYVDEFVAKSELKKRDDVRFVATSSTPLRLVSMIRDFGIYDRERADGEIIKAGEVAAAVESILKLSCGEMAANKYIGDKRSVIFVAACIIFQTICQGLDIPELMASLKSAKDGIVEELIESENHGQAYKVC